MAPLLSLSLLAPPQAPGPPERPDPTQAQTWSLDMAAILEGTVPGVTTQTICIGASACDTQRIDWEISSLIL